MSTNNAAIKYLNEDKLKRSVFVFLILELTLYVFIASLFILLITNFIVEVIKSYSPWLIGLFIVLVYLFIFSFFYPKFKLMYKNELKRKRAVKHRDKIIALGKKYSGKILRSDFKQMDYYEEMNIRAYFLTKKMRKFIMNFYGLKTRYAYTATVEYTDETGNKIIIKTDELNGNPEKSEDKSVSVYVYDGIFYVTDFKALRWQD